jgi:ADP-ribosylglycohydrolase
LRCTNEQIKSAITSALNEEILDVSQNKGWVVHALYVALITIFHTSSFEEAMEYIAEHFIKGDTDTIMAIAGGLVGALVGYQAMSEELKTSVNLFKVDAYFSTTSRPRITPELLKFVTTHLSSVSS